MLFKKRKGRRGSRNKKGVEEKVIKRKKKETKKKKNIQKKGKRENTKSRNKKLHSMNRKSTGCRTRLNNHGWSEWRHHI